MIPALKESEGERLRELEKTIVRGQRQFVEVGAALSEIRDKKLYRVTYKTFEDYCREKWGWNRQRASQLIQAASVVESLPERVSSILDNPRQAEAVFKVQPESRVEVIESAKARADEEERPMTAKDIKTADDELKQAFGGTVPEIPEDPEQDYIDFLHRFDEAFQSANKLTGNNRTKAAHAFATAPAQLKKLA